MTLRFKLYALTLVLSAMALVFVVLRANEAIAVRHAIAQAVTINAIADRYLAAAADWAVERGTANTVVANPTAATPAQRQTILQRRQAGDAAFAEAGRLVAEATFLPDSARQFHALAQAIGQRARRRLADVLDLQEVDDLLDLAAMREFLLLRAAEPVEHPAQEARLHF